MARWAPGRQEDVPSFPKSTADPDGGDVVPALPDPSPHADATQAAATAANLERFSLLWPEDAGSRATQTLTPTTCADLDLDEVLRTIAGRDRRREAAARAVLTATGADAATIAYRQGVLRDLLAHPELATRLSAILPLLAELGQPAERVGEADDWGVLPLTRRATDLALYTRAVGELRAALLEARPQAQALRRLERLLAAETDSADFQAVIGELPSLREQLRQGESITIAINLTPSWEPESAAIVGIGPRNSGKGTLIGRLWPGAPDQTRGLSPLRRTGPVDALRGDNVLFRDLRALLETTAGAALAAIAKLANLGTAKLCHLESEIAFYLGAAHLCRRVQAAGLPLCWPEIAAVEARETHIAGAYNLALALRLLHSPDRGRHRLVPTDVVFDGERGRVWILTGPNRGGKTTFLRAVGLAHVLCGAGLPVAGTAAVLSPVDQVLTHFLGPETAAAGEGRLDEEAERLAAVFTAATPQSLILLNEVLAGTNQVEALALATEAVQGLRLLGARCVYATHLHDLALAADRINAAVAGADSPVASLVAGVRPPGVADDGPAYWIGEGPPPEPEPDDGEPHATFRVAPGPPQGRSFASAIARAHGITFAQIRATLRARGMGDGSP